MCVRDVYIRRRIHQLFDGESIVFPISATTHRRRDRRGFFEVFFCLIRLSSKHGHRAKARHHRTSLLLEFVKFPVSNEEKKHVSVKKNEKKTRRRKLHTQLLSFAKKNTMEDTTRRLYRARKTCCEMLQDRGYIVPSQERAETWQDFLQRFQENEKNRSRMLLVAAHKLDPDDRVIVYFADETKKTGVKPIRELTERMEERNIQRAILVTQNVLTAFARDAITEAAPRHIIENFLEAELLVNITKHELVPKHVPLTTDEKQSLLNRYRVKEVQLPRIQCADPVARYFGLHRGQVVKIIRSSETAGRYVTYRLVV